MPTSPPIAAALRIICRAVRHLPRANRSFVLLACAFLASSAFGAQPAEDRSLEAARRQFQAGQYEGCRDAARQAIAAGAASDRWAALKAETELTLGQYAAARATAEVGLRAFPESLPLRLLCARACQRLGEGERVQSLLGEIERFATRAPWRFTRADDLLALGEAALMAGADPRDVREGFFERARQLNPSRREPVLALSRLAIEQHDHKEAVAILERAALRFPRDADIQFGLAVSYGSEQPAQAAAALDRALSLNPNHLAALLMKADRFIDCERLSQAEAALEQIRSFNPHDPDAWAFRAVVAHLKSDAREEARCRAAGLAVAARNPGVDHLIGLKLSQKYRFAEGAAYQRRALAIDPAFLPARMQLCQDLLRLGDETEAWQLAEAVYKVNRNDVVAHNLIELRDRLAKFRTIEDEDFIIRMESEEAEVYGDRVLALLRRAKRVLCAKYDLDLKSRITVEIYPNESDFAVRTFGMPGTSGFLGVCFGKVITANSPAALRDEPCNWEAVLWHEFCHVVTLELTRNKMPRWLSEGISVYEEWQADSTWGLQMSPKFRDVVVSGEMAPIADLSAAFLAPQESQATQFAYYQSALLVEYIVETFGHDALCAVLRDLGNGLLIRDAIERHTQPLASLDADFQKYALRRARALAPRIDWAAPEPDGEADAETLALLVEKNSRNYEAHRALAQTLLEQGKWEQAKAPLRQMIHLFPDYVGGDNPHELLALVHRELREEAQERRLLAEYAKRDSAAVHAFLRLMELEADAGKWAAVLKNAERARAVNPMLPQVYRATAEAAEELGDGETAVDACRTLLALDTGDPAAVHYRLARLLYRRQDPRARQHVLAALEQAPRYRAALRLLREMSDASALTARD